MKNILKIIFFIIIGVISFFVIGFGIYYLIKKYQKLQKNTNSNNPSFNDIPSAMLNIVCFFIPICGLIAYLSIKEYTPVKAKSAVKSTLWGIGIYFILIIIC